ncbi:MAG: DUF6261 family protein, partial [Tannerellaceae bacterium]
TKACRRRKTSHRATRKHAEDGKQAIVPHGQHPEAKKPPVVPHGRDKTTDKYKKIMGQIKELDLGKLRQEESFGFHTLANAETAKCKDEKLKPLQTDYNHALIGFDAALKTGGGNPLSETITQLDGQRDEAYSGLVAQIRNSVHHFDPDKAATAREADLILRKYGNPSALPYLEENGVLHNLIQELREFDNHPEGPIVVSVLTASTDRLTASTDRLTASTDRLTTIGAAEWLERLETVNNQFLEVFSSRNTAQADVVTGASKATRMAVDDAYRAVVKRINALAEVNGETDYISYINALNALIDRQKSVLAARKTANKKKADDDRPDRV